MCMYHICEWQETRTEDTLENTIEIYSDLNKLEKLIWYKQDGIQHGQVKKATLKKAKYFG